MISRKPTWHADLTAYLAQAARVPFAEGVSDCALFAAGAVEAMTGVDLAARWRGRYRTTRGGLRVLRKAGYADHLALVAEHFAEIAPALARAGDLAAVETPDGLALALVQGEHIYVRGPAGIALVPLTSAARAFRVV